jgi:mannan endo-1,4-beta-mannosidase
MGNLFSRRHLFQVGGFFLTLYAGRKSAKGQNASTLSQPPPRSSFYTQGRYIYDRLGNKVIFRGVNKMSVWDGDDPTGAISFSEIRKTGANSVRIVWLMSDQGIPTDLETLDDLIANARNNQLIPLVELHDATGDWSRLPELITYWTQPSVVELIQKHQEYLLINIGNEVGDDQVSNTQFIVGYTNAIQAMRASGIYTPLVIDAPDWGKNLAILDSSASALIDIDPYQNLIFSVHLYWPLSCGKDANYIRRNLENSVRLGYPLIVGEFSKFGGYPCDNPEASKCSSSGEIDYQTILAVCHDNEIGWYAWEWGPGNDIKDSLCAAMDMTSDRLFNSLKPGWAEEVALSSPYSIKNTSITPPTMY